MVRARKEPKGKEVTARILLLDIETAPGLGYAWSKYDTNIIEYEREWFILCYGYKWLGEASVTVKALPDFKSYKKTPQDDTELMKSLWSLLDEADIIVAHNGDSFDVKRVNARFLVHGLKPPSTYKTVDTLKLLRKHFKFDSNKLNDIGKSLGIGTKKSHTGFALWKGCMSGDLAAWEVMKEYNAQDIVLLEDTYLRLRPWATNHPDVSLYGDGHSRDKHACPSCGSNHVHRRGTAVARTRRYQRLNCQDCGSWFSGEIEK